MIIGVGIDIVEVKRLKDILERWKESFLMRIFSREELQQKVNLNPLHLAGRFAAKEAVIKALGKKNISFKDIKIFNDEDGRPLCKVKDLSQEIFLSISHTKEYAIASAIITQKT